MSESFNAQQIAEIRLEIQTIIRLLNDAPPKFKQVNREVREQINVLTAAMALSDEMFGTHEYSEVIRNARRIIMTILMMVRTYQMALAATGWGIPLAVISTLATASSTVNVVGSYG